jgi:hypothetical protein
MLCVTIVGITTSNDRREIAKPDRTAGWALAAARSAPSAERQRVSIGRALPEFPCRWRPRLLRLSITIDWPSSSLNLREVPRCRCRRPEEGSPPSGSDATVTGVAVGVRRAKRRAPHHTRPSESAASRRAKFQRVTACQPRASSCRGAPLDFGRDVCFCYETRHDTKSVMPPLAAG